MSVSRALADMALRRCLLGEALEREALLELLAVPPASDEALYLRHAAHKAALALDGGRAYLQGAGPGLYALPHELRLLLPGGSLKLSTRRAVIRDGDHRPRAGLCGGGRAFRGAAHHSVLRNLAALCGMLAAIRKAVPGGYEIILNTGEFDADAALAVRRAGGSGVYHTIRVREGRIRPLTRMCAKPPCWRRFARACVWWPGGAGGPGTRGSGTGGLFLRIMTTGASISGVMARVPVPGTPLGDQPPLSPARLAQLAAIFRLAGGGRLAGVCAHPAALENMTAGANIVVVEKGAIPRDSAPSERDWCIFSAAGACGGCCGVRICGP